MLFGFYVLNLIYKDVIICINVVILLLILFYIYMYWFVLFYLVWYNCVDVDEYEFLFSVIIFVLFIVLLVYYVIFLGNYSSL